ncbi:MAG: hypothetical protein ACE5IR_21245 [bacterium]
MKEGIGESPFSVVSTPNGELLFVNNTASHAVSVILNRERRVVNRIPVGEMPIVMVVHPTGATLWISCEGSHELYIIDIPQDIEMMKKRMHAEIHQLHQFFEDWFSGKLADTDENFSRLQGVLAENFQIISPDGRVTTKADLAPALRKAHASRARAKKPFRIWIENIQIRLEHSSNPVATYEEWQEIDGETKARISTVIFKARGDAPNGLEWLHVHETWLSKID